MSGKSDGKKQPDPGSTHAVEWVLGGISALLVLALSVFLIVEGVTKTGGTPLLSLHVIEIVDQGAVANVVIEVRNDGHATAADVEIAGTIGGEPLARRVVLDYAPAESRRQVTLSFPAPVAEEALTLSVLGYGEP